MATPQPHFSRRSQVKMSVTQTAPIHNNTLLFFTSQSTQTKALHYLAGKFGELLLEASGLRKAHKSSSDTKHCKYWTKQPVHLL